MAEDEGVVRLWAIACGDPDVADPARKPVMGYGPESPATRVTVASFRSCYRQHRGAVAQTPPQESLTERLPRLIAKRETHSVQPRHGGLFMHSGRLPGTE